MNHHQDFTPAEREQLEQELMELHFGCHENPERLEARLADEPALRALQAKVLQQATLLETAVRPEQPTLPLRAPKAPKATTSRWRWLRDPRGRLLTAAAAAAATVLGFFVAERIAHHRLSSFECERLHLTVSAPKAVPAGAAWNFTVQTADLRGAPKDCRVRWQAFDGSGAVLAANETAVAGGSATIAMPADLRVPQRIEILASHATDEVRQVFTLSTAQSAPLVHVTTDRPVYRPGEPVFVRAVVLDRVTRLPLPNAVRLQAQLLDAKGAPIGSDHDLEAPAGTGSFLLRLPAESQGGPHRVKVQSLDGLFPAETAELVVRSFQPPQLKKQIVLDRVSYAPGARGAATVTAERLSAGGGAVGAQAKAVLLVDGTEVWSEQKTLAANGDATFRFTVPAQVDKGAGRFVATITDGGIVETEVKPFVVPTGKVLLAAFPEGGELVAGVENRVYLECTDPLGRPIDGTGELRDERDELVARFRTEHQGRAQVTFVPREGRSYRVRLPGQTEPFALPAVQTKGLALQARGDEIAANAPLRLAVAGRGFGPWLLGVFCRGVLVGQTTLRPDDRGELRADAEVPLPANATGVLRATVFDRSLQPVAERLVRRLAGERLDVAITPKLASLLPGASQEVTVRTTDEAGRPQRAVVGMSVTDLGIVSLGTEPRVGLVDQALLFADVERMENLGDFFLGNAANARHVDLLLGTRGWRRFVWRNDAPAQAAIAARGEAGAGVLAREGFSHTPQVASNLAAAKAPAVPFATNARNAERHLRDAAGFAGMALGLVLVLELLAGLLRNAARMPPLLHGYVGASLLVGIVALGFAAVHRTVIGSSEAAGTWLADFDGDIDGLPGAATLSLPPTLEFEVTTEQAARVFFSEAEAISIVRRFASPDEDEMPSYLLPTVLAFDEFDAVSRNLGWCPPDLRLPVDLTAGGWDDRILDGASAGVLHLLRERQYAHQHTDSTDRRDFAPLLFWNTLLLTEANGEANVSFATSDAVTTWLVQADAHTAKDTGRLGQGTATFATQQPLQVEAKLPAEVSAEDRIELPIAVIVADPTITECALTATLGTGLTLAADAPSTIALQNGRGRAILPITVGTTLGDVALTIDVRAGRFHDRVRHTLRIAPRGFPHRRSLGGAVETGEPSTTTLAIPHDAVPGSGRVTLKVYPSPIATLTEGLAGIVQEPHGCFEQASSSNYPNTLVLTLLDASGDDVPAVAARARELLPKGYRKITGYECRQKGYEWFGADPGHEALTAYGLLQFHDMRKVFDVDAAMVERTQQWLLARRDGKGNYPHAGQDHHSFGGCPTPVTNAYVTYALLQAGTPAKDITIEIDALVARATTDDPYELALIACALHLAGRPEAAAARTRLAGLQAADGSLRSTTTSITQSGGQDLAVETTGFAILAWLPDPAHTGHVRTAIEFVQRCRDARGTFGATQATIAALRALTAYATTSRSMQKDGTLRVFADDREIGTRAFAASDTGALTFELWNDLTPGEHVLRLEVEGGGGPLPWAIDVAYHAEQPADDPAATITITTSLRAATVAEGATVALDVVVTNTTDAPVPTPIAVIGLPAGLEVPTRVLEDLQKAEAFASWELKGRELVLYWRGLSPLASSRLTLDLVARTPGRSTGPASRANPYYTPQQKRWAAPLTIDIPPAK